ncbi:MAG: HugZ family protein [Bradymonadaceae bacterium]
MSGTRARSLLEDCDRGTLSTQGAAFDAPYGSFVRYALDEQGRPLFLLSDLAVHTSNLETSARSSLLVVRHPGADDPLDGERATLVGSTERRDVSDADRRLYLDRHPSAEQYVDFEDFHFYSMTPERVRFIGGFGDVEWIEPGDLRGGE